MKLYRLTWENPVGTYFRWATSQIESRAMRREIQRNESPLGVVDITPVEFELTRSGMARWLNIELTKKNSV